MAKPITALRIGLRQIARRQIATKPVDTPVGRVYNVGSFTFTAPHAGRYTFAIWGPGGFSSGGGGGGIGGASGALSVITKRLRIGEVVAIVVGATTNSTLTFVDGTAVTAGKATTTTPGTATGGDTNVSGVANSGSNGGAAPSSGVYLGGSGATSVAPVGHGGGGWDPNIATPVPGGAGLCVVHSYD
jgi:hypothetical protein